MEGEDDLLGFRDLPVVEWPARGRGSGALFLPGGPLPSVILNCWLWLRESWSAPAAATPPVPRLMCCPSCSSASAATPVLLLLLLLLMFLFCCYSSCPSPAAAGALYSHGLALTLGFDLMLNLFSYTSSVQLSPLLSTISIIFPFHLLLQKYTECFKTPFLSLIKARSLSDIRPRASRSLAMTSQSPLPA